MWAHILSLLLLAAVNSCSTESYSKQYVYDKRYRAHFSHGARSLQAADDLGAAWPDEPLDAKGCPNWLGEYIEFHRKNRAKSNAKYLISYCSRKVAGKCPGLGDRFRGMLYAAKLAMATSRVLLIWWDFPAALEIFMEPSDINWLVTDDLDINMDDVMKHQWSFKLDKDTGRFSADHYTQRVISISTNQFDEGNVQPGPHFTLVSKPSSCLFNALWQPSQIVVERALEVREQLLGEEAKDGNYVAVHLRMGHLAGEMYDVNRGWDRYKGLLGVLRCAQHYALDGSKKRSLCSSSDGSGNGENGCGEGSDEEGSGRALLRTSTNNSGRDSGKKDGAGSKVVTVGKGSLGARSNASNDNWDFNPPVLLMTDDVVLRTMVADGLFRGFVGPAYIAHHLQRTTDTATIDEHVGTFVDLMLLAKSRCFIHSASGFSKSAMLWGWPECETEVKHCLARHYQHVTGEAPSSSG